MKNQSCIFIVIFLYSILLIACENRIDEQKTGKNSEIENTKDTVIVSKKNSAIRRLHPKFKVTEYCDREDQDSVLFYLSKFSKKMAFNIIVEHANNELKVTYRVIDDCCLKFQGNASLDSLKLNLFHIKRQENPCECFCMYEFELLIRKIDAPERLFINNKEVQF